MYSYWRVDYYFIEWLYAAHNYLVCCERRYKFGPYTASDLYLCHIYSLPSLPGSNPNNSFYSVCASWRPSNIAWGRYTSRPPTALCKKLPGGAYKDETSYRFSPIISYTYLTAWTHFASFILSSWPIFYCDSCLFTINTCVYNKHVCLVFVYVKHVVRIVVMLSFFVCNIDPHI